MIDKEYSDVQPKITKLHFNNTDELVRLGFIKEVSITIVPSDQEETVSPYNDRYSLTLFYSARIPEIKFAKLMKNTRFGFEGNDQECESRVLVRSIKKKS